MSRIRRHGHKPRTSFTVDDRDRFRASEPSASMNPPNASSTSLVSILLFWPSNASSIVLISDAVYSLRVIFFFAAFLTTSISNLIRSGLISRSQSSSSELIRTDDHDHLILLLDHEQALD